MQSVHFVSVIFHNIAYKINRLNFNIKCLAMQAGG